MTGLVIVAVAVIGGTLVGQWDRQAGLVMILGLGALGLAVTWVDLS